jgi:hypothetical protein
LIDKLEHAARYTESTVQIFLTMGQAVAVGTAIGSGTDRTAVEARARKSGEASRAELEDSMREPLRRLLAYGYRNLSDSDLRHLLSFLDSSAGKRYVSAYIAAMDAGFDAMGRRCGEHLGGTLRELALAQSAAVTDSAPASAPPPPP